MAILTAETDAEGIAVIVLDDPSRSTNVICGAFVEELIAAIERIASDPTIVGAIITSAKPDFIVGTDLDEVLARAGGTSTLVEAFEFSQRVSVAMHRRLETCGKPFVAAINGPALGIGYELALACHHRVVVDEERAVVGLPEAAVGLLPRSGGTQRLPRMIGVEAALPLLLDGATVPPAEARQQGLVDRTVAREQLLEAARAWIREHRAPLKPWDLKGYRGSYGLLEPELAKVMTAQAARVAKRTRHNYPAPIAILDCVFRGMQLPFDTALRVESANFARLLCDPVSRNLIRTGFVNKRRIAKLSRRPPEVTKAAISRVAVIGAGMMGSAIAYVAAAASVDVVLLDRTPELAAKGIGYSANLLAKAVAGGKYTQAAADATLARIHPTGCFDDLAGCQLVIEAVFEDVELKAEVTAAAERVVPESAIFATNTSTLPIGTLARASQRPEQFLGLHFFSPVDRMQLVEVIMGAATNRQTLARSLDFVDKLGKIPIVVNDGRGFYTSRVFQTYIHEGMRMLGDGVEPARVENAALAAGFPIGPLALVDEVTLELPWKIVQQAERELGDRFSRPCAYGVMRRMLEEFRRPGRRGGGGFYEYPRGAAKRLWPGLTTAFPPTSAQPTSEELKARLLYIQALETSRCLEEGIIEQPAEADLGALLGWGFPSWTGGPLSLIDTIGIRTFVVECERMSHVYGSRFEPGDALRDRARRGEPFYALSASHQELASCGD